MIRPATASVITSPIIGSGASGGIGDGVAGDIDDHERPLAFGERERLRDDLRVPDAGVRRRLKIEILSSASSCSNAPVKSDAWYVVNGVVGRSGVERGRCEGARPGGRIRLAGLLRHGDEARHRGERRPEPRLEGVALRHRRAGASRVILRKVSVLVP